MGNLKYKDPKTNEFKKMHVKAVDTLPVGTIVEIPDNMSIPDGYELVNDEEWIDLEYLNDWQRHSATFDRLQYKKAGNQVFLRGMVKNSNTLTTTTRAIAKLPDEILPKNACYLTASTGNKFIVIVIDNYSKFIRTDETTYTANAFLSLNGISYFVD